MKLTRAANNRVHIYNPTDWGSSVGTDYWFYAGNVDGAAAAAATDPSGLSGYGWTTTSVVHTNTVTGDFGSLTDVTPVNYGANASGDLTRSPLIFGDGAHFQAVGKMLGYTPTRLNAEFYANFATATADEAATNIGFHNGSAGVAVIYSDSANFALTKDGGTTEDVGAEVDNAWHLWKITATVGGTYEWFIDGTSQGTLALLADAWPAGFGWVASTTNRINLNFAHVWYD